MRKTLLFSTLLVFAIACTDNTDEFIMSDIHSTVTTRSITPEISPYFNWQDTAFINLEGIFKPVTLPWYSGAATSIPNFILTDYKAEDGWKLLYNFCSPSQSSQEGKYYLIFYNIFSGRLRGFVYNNNDVTNANTTFWRLTFNAPTQLANDFGDRTYAQDTIINNAECYVTNLSNTDIKSLTRGWNTFEFDLLLYDKDIAQKNVAMRFDLYDVDKNQISITGDLKLNSEGTIVTVTKVPDKGGVEKKKEKIDALENAAKKYFEDRDGAKTRIGAGTIIDLLAKGANLIVDKFSAKKTSDITSNSSIKITTTGKVNLTGSMTSQHQSNILPLTRLMVPGSTPTIEDIFLPSYNEPIGVWNLESTPKVIPSSYLNHCILPAPKTNQKFFQGCLVYIDYIKLDKSSVNVKINPSILPYISKYDVDINYIIKTSSLLPKTNNFEIPIGWQGQSLYEIKQDSVNYITPVGGDVFYHINAPNILKTFPMVTYQYPPKFNKVKSNTITKHPTGVIKVTVTLYPKAPFNATPYVSTRTFLPKLGEPQDYQSFIPYLPMITIPLP